MKKLSLIILMFFVVSCIPTTPVFAAEESTVYIGNPDLIMSTWIASAGCQSKEFLLNLINQKPSKKWLIYELDNAFVNEVGSDYAPVSCKGKVCWSWKVARNYLDTLTLRVFSSDLPLQITNTKRISESVSQTIKESNSLRKSAGALVDAAQEFVKATFSGEKGKAIEKERSMSQSEVREQGATTNITPLFHNFLARAVLGGLPVNPLPYRYALCISGAVDLFWRAYENQRVDDLLQAFVLYQTVKPEDIEFSDELTLLNKAKFLYSQSIFLLQKGDPQVNNEVKKNAWAQALVFATVLKWPEFQEVKQIVETELKKAYQKYVLLKKQTTREIAAQDKNLAANKYVVDKEIVTKLNQNNDVTKDDYVVAATMKPSDAVVKRLEEALQKNDPVIDQKFVKDEPLKAKTKISWLPVAVIAVVVVAAIVFIKRRKKGGK